MSSASSSPLAMPQPRAAAPSHVPAGCRRRPEAEPDSWIASWPTAGSKTAVWMPVFALYEVRMRRHWHRRKWEPTAALY
jgi:hypothetical protein